ncbi:uncharacterized protein TNCV_295541 [Trichonephila clavipes]|nr:uncharacterized protein TNCV_295541 [Trichonephila clavipes]
MYWGCRKNPLPLERPSLSIGNRNCDEDIRLHKCDQSEERANVSDDIPVNPDMHVFRDGTEWIRHNSNVPGKFATRNVLPQSSGPAGFGKHNVNVSFLWHKGS